MSKDLIIVESPAKAKTIGKFLGNQYIIKASMGHIRDLPQKSLGVDVKNNFKPQYVTDPRKKKVIMELKEAAEKASHIYLAPDHDREGEAIAWHLAQVLGNGIKDKPLHRIVFNEITRSAIQQALSHPGEIDENKVNSQQARRILDRIVGYNISPLLWRVLTKNLSAGRVQSVALRLICERETEIGNFQPQEYWSLEAVLYRDQLPPFRAILQKWEGSKIDIKEGIAAGEIKKQLDQQQFILSNIADSSKKVQPPPPFITSSLQQDAARLFNFSAKKTMMIAQQLYEGIEVAGDTAGLITYMRTDSLRIAGEAVDNARKLVQERFGEQELIARARVFKNKSRSQDAHEAIRPTDCFRTPEAVSDYLNKEQLKLYTLIWQRFVATQMQPVKMHTRTFEITAGPGVFSCSGSSVTEKGFSLAYPHIKLILGEKLHPDYRINDQLAVKEMESLQHFTKPPVRYTEASLIKELETLGIGRPSTYATITNTIRERKYVATKNKSFEPTELGIQVNRFLVDNFSDFFNVKFTAKMEDSLDQVEYGKVEWHELLEGYYQEMTRLMKDLDMQKAKQETMETTDIKCDKCGSPMIIKWGKRGQFLACSSFPKCKNIKNFEKDDQGKIRIVETEKVAEKCPKCGGDLVIKNGRFGKFIACSNFPRCKFTKPVSLDIKCPACEIGDIVEKRNKKGKTFYSCSRYPDCKFLSNTLPEKKECPHCGHIFYRSRDKQNELNHCPHCGGEID